jgi:uncharacterized protein YndB with AHSA1/START domain
MKSEIEMEGHRLRMTRVFEAPRERVFEWWTRPEKLSQWSGCKEAIHCEFEMDFRPGGSFTQKMTIAVPGGTCDFTITGTYEEIVAPERIVYQAKLGPAPTRVTVEFFEEGKSTKVVLTHEGLPDEMHRQNISRGTGESFDKLDALLGQALAAAPGGEGR